METPDITLTTLSREPGVYIYKDSEGAVIYVGKAKDLKRRVSQYFTGSTQLGEKTQKLVSQIVSIETIKTHNEFDALILESRLIRDYNPKYNIIAKDDKSPIYVSISTDEELPRITCVRKTAMTGKPKRIYFGPFQSFRTIRALLRELRGIAPYCSQKVRDGHPCFYTHLGLCKPCASVIARLPVGTKRQRQVTLYRANIRLITDIFSGKSLRVLHNLELQMNRYAKKEFFEKATDIKRSVFRMRQLLNAHYDPSLYIESESFVEKVYEEDLEVLRRQLLLYYPHLPVIHRLECIDISNTAGTNPTGSLVVQVDGKPDTSLYKRFKIRSSGPNDFAMIAEVVQRRFRHVEWTNPDVLVIDGGKGQVNAAREELSKLSLDVPVIGIAKRFEEIIVPSGNTCITLRLPVSSKALHMIQKLRDESHRFTLSYHRTLRKKAFLTFDHPQTI